VRKEQTKKRVASGDCAIVIACDELPGYDAVMESLKRIWAVKHFEIITAPAPEQALIKLAAEPSSSVLGAQIGRAIQNASVKYLAIVSHCDCRMNTASYVEQTAMLRKSVDLLAAQYANTKVAGIWIDLDGNPAKVEL
jgi:hypothetical protein